MPLFSANKLPCGPPAPPPSCFTPRPAPASSFSRCSSHHYVSGDTRLFCIRLFSPLWQAGRHANMQNGDREAFCSVMRKGRWRKLTCVLMLVYFPTESLAHKSDSWYRSKSHQNQLTNVATEYQPKQPLILHGGILSSTVAFIPLKGTPGGKFFPTCVIAINPHDDMNLQISSAN